MSIKEAFEKVKDACVGFDTVDELIELKKLVEKATPKKPNKIKECISLLGGTFKDGLCTSCDERVTIYQKYCQNCGQAIDWSNVLSLDKKQSINLGDTDE